MSMPDEAGQQEPEVSAETPEAATPEAPALWEPSELDLETIETIISKAPDSDEKEAHLGMFSFYFKKLNKEFVALRDSTLASSRAREILDTSDDDEIVAVREEIAEKSAEIAEARKPIDEKIETLKANFKARLEEFEKELDEAVGDKEDLLDKLTSETLKRIAGDNSSGVSPEDAIENAKSLIAKIKRQENDAAWAIERDGKKVPVYSFIKNDVPSFVEVIGKDAMEIYFDSTKSKKTGGPRKLIYLEWISLDGGPRNEWTMTDLKKAIGRKDENTYDAVTKYLAEVAPNGDLEQVSITEPTTFKVPGKLGKVHEVTVLRRAEKNAE